MQIGFLAVAALVAFAANSVLTRAALALGEIEPGAFAALRMTSGAIMLVLLVVLRNGGHRNLLHHGQLGGVVALLLYMLGFSFAYLRLDTGLGALILFGGVQVTMFAGAMVGGERPQPGRWLGALLGLLGLAILVWPGDIAPDPFSAALMLLAAVGWGVYSLYGRRPGPALAKTAANFLWASPVALLVWGIAPGEIPASGLGITLAIASGALASGMGYAIWYAVLPRLDASLAAVIQLTVPILALLGGVVFLGEALTLRFAIAAILILGGVGIAVRKSPK